MASIQADLTAYSAALKTRYSPDGMTEMMQEITPFFTLVKKDNRNTGNVFAQPVAYSGGTMVSPNLANLITSANGGAAVANAAPYPYVASQQAVFQLTRARTYGLARLDIQTIRASSDKEGAFEELIEHEVDRTVNSVAVRVASLLYGTGTGSMGQISSAVGSVTSGTTITLADPTNAQYWQIGDVVFASATDGSALRTGTSLGYVAITGINYIAGTLTAAVNWNANTASAQGINGLSTGDFLYHADEGANGSTNPAGVTTSTGWTVPVGIQAWLQGGNLSTADSFGTNGVNRSVSSRLAGLNFTFSGVPLDECANRALAAIYANGGKPSHLFLNPVTWGAFVNLLQGKVTYFRQAPKDASQSMVGFESIKVYTPGGSIVDVVADPFCPSSKMCVLQMDTWALRATDPVPYIQDTEGGSSGDQLLRVAASDQVELRVAAYYQLVCRAPGWNALVNIDPAVSY